MKITLEIVCPKFGMLDSDKLDHLTYPKFTEAIFQENPYNQEVL